jgi:hypothetical protein
MIMKRKLNTIHSRKLVMSYEERVTFDRDKQYYLDLGYPEWKAEQYAWDHYSAAKRKVVA